MVAKKKASAGKKLKLKRETIKNLEVKGRGAKVKGGAIPRTDFCKTVEYTRCICL